LIFFSFIVLLITLMFGLHPNGFYFSNNAKWIMDSPGIRFKTYGIAYTSLITKSIAGMGGQSGCFAIEMALKPKRINRNRFEFILAFHNGKDRDQLIIAQWRSSLIIMNGDDYANKKRIKRIAIRRDDQLLNKILLTITTSDKETKVFMDGRLVAEKELRLKIPRRSETTQLVLGNSVYGKHPWEGDIFGLAIYARELSDEDVTRHNDQWSREQNFYGAIAEHPYLLYLFDEKKGEIAHDHANGNNPLKIPKRFHILKKKLLESQWMNLRFSKSLLMDSIINFIGFIPLGFIFTITYLVRYKRLKIGSFLMIAVICSLVSFCIEMIQIWMPSRTSSNLDFILNTGGAVTGIFIGAKAFSFWERTGQERSKAI